LHASYQSRWSKPFSTARAEKGKRVSAALQRRPASPVVDVEICAATTFKPRRMEKHPSLAP
jgi:hypothetical protein